MTTIYDDSGPIDDISIRELEKLIQFQLPNEYKQFLQTHNGGRPKPQSLIYHVPIHGDRIGSINKFFGISDEDDRYSILREVKHFRSYIQSGLLPTADEGGGNYIFLPLSGENRGKVFFWNHNIDPSEGNLFFVANSFDELLGTLFEYVEDEDS